MLTAELEEVMKVDVGISGDLSSAAEEARRAERLGYDGLKIAEQRAIIEQCMGTNRSLRAQASQLQELKKQLQAEKEQRLKSDAKAKRAISHLKSEAEAERVS